MSQTKRLRTHNTQQNISLNKTNTTVLFCIKDGNTLFEIDHFKTSFRYLPITIHDFLKLYRVGLMTQEKFVIVEIVSELIKPL